MSRLSKTITAFGLTIIGLIITPVAAKSFTIQKATQSALVSGYNNKVEQNIYQTNTDVFTIDIDLSREIFNYYDDGTFEQDSEQAAFIIGDDNQVIQKITQIQVNLFDVFINLSNLEEAAFINNNVIIPFLEQVSNLAMQSPQPTAVALCWKPTRSRCLPLLRGANWNNNFVTIEQLSYQEIVIEGEGNQITQQINQKAITIFSFNTTLNLTPSITQIVQNSWQRSLKIDESNQITQEVNQTQIELFVFGMDDLSLDKLIESASQSPGLDISPAEIVPTVPEAISVISLLALGTMGISLKIYRYFKF